MSPRFDLQLDRDRYRPGDSVAGTVLVREGGRSRSLEVQLGYIEETDDYLEVATSISTGHLHKGDLETGASFCFELALPPDALRTSRPVMGSCTGSWTSSPMSAAATPTSCAASRSTEARLSISRSRPPRPTAVGPATGRAWPAAGRHGPPRALG